MLETVGARFSVLRAEEASVGAQQVLLCSLSTGAAGTAASASPLGAHVIADDSPPLPAGAAAAGRGSTISGDTLSFRGVRPVEGSAELRGVREHLGLNTESICRTLRSLQKVTLQIVTLSRARLAAPPGHAHCNLRCKTTVSSWFREPHQNRLPRRRTQIIIQTSGR